MIECSTCQKDMNEGIDYEHGTNVGGGGSIRDCGGKKLVLKLHIEAYIALKLLSHNCNSMGVSKFVRMKITLHE